MPEKRKDLLSTPASCRVAKEQANHKQKCSCNKNSSVKGDLSNYDGVYS